MADWSPLLSISGTGRALWLFADIPVFPTRVRSDDLAALTTYYRANWIPKWTLAFSGLDRELADSTRQSLDATYSFMACCEEDNGNS